MPSANGTNGTATCSFPPGIHVPSLTWFKNDASQEIDWDVQEKHFEFLISNGLHGIVIAGTNGEAATLSSSEKTQLVQKARKNAQRLGRGDLPITIGGVAGCTRDAIQQTVEAREAGASYYLALVPSYFHFSMNQDAIVAYFNELADASPIPLVLYNFPNVVAGLDINSEMLDILGKHKNIVAVKLTCGGIAKVARISAAFEKSEFVALAGQSDWLVPALSVGGVGTITGVANLYPKHAEASALQIKLSVTEWGFGKSGINGTKYVVAHKRGYPESSADCRRPYPRYTDEEKRRWVVNQVSGLDELESSL
ncbi:dihydrodipicolinate synthase [Stemphylium lycopersici]|uniref:Dihydrodipicolinate synthase n=1 Tax=Stemphylium lycopersici TaxID=183478 RepID=A0A364NF49_STELY|nr:dihydrodipicolinate synthase [Stemphylium lycopersici]RAR05776.1 dihydrodipicolinate synthase [Stemphylium lycopersici]RAR15896.1 dihydrodipicolinate synthase [Stemphylium lycopersici]